MAFYYTAMKAMDDRTAAVETTLELFLNHGDRYLIHKYEV